jgi:hypothetical protein
VGLFVGAGIRLVCSFHWREAAPVSARQAGNFHLLTQMKVTKAKGLKPSFVLHAPARRVLLMTDF